MLKEFGFISGMKSKKSFCYSSYFPKAAKLYNYNYVTPFPDAAMIPLDHAANVFLYERDLLYLRNMVRKAGSLK